MARFYSPLLCRLNSPQVATIARIILRLLKSNCIDRDPSSFKLGVVPTGLKEKNNIEKRRACWLWLFVQGQKCLLGKKQLAFSSSKCGRSYFHLKQLMTDKPLLLKYLSSQLLNFSCTFTIFSQHLIMHPLSIYTFIRHP